MDMGTMKPTPLPIDVTLNQEETRAILHINCQSDGRRTRWLGDEEEGGECAKQSWLGKLGCLLKVHGNLQYIFGDPWAYRISDFPKNYKLFAIKRQADGNGYPQEDHYLCGGEHDYRSPQEFYPHMHWLLENAQGVNRPCICKYCDPSRNQTQINEIYPLPPCKKSPKRPRGPKNHWKTRKHQGPKGVTSQRGMVTIRNSITTGPVTTQGCYGEGRKIIGYKTSHPFRP